MALTCWICGFVGAGLRKGTMWLFPRFLSPPESELPREIEPTGIGPLLSCELRAMPTGHLGKYFHTV